MELVCIVHARPAASVIWTKDGAQVPKVARAVDHLGGHRHVLTLSPVQKEDFGLYECKAENKYGQSVKAISVTGKKFNGARCSVGFY